MGKTTTSIGLLLFVTLLVGCDHGTKHLAARHLRGEPALQLIGNVLGLRYTENRDAAFSALRWLSPRTRRPLVIACQAIISLVVLVMLLRRRGLGMDRLALSLILAGALGNLTDRVARGFVVDFIHLRYWPVFNVADICITVGVAMLLLAELRRSRPPRINRPA